MPASPRILKERGCHPSAWKKLFTAKSKDKSRKIRALEDLIINRIQDGRNRNIDEFRTYRAIDLAMESAFAQTTPTIIGNLLSRKWENDEQLLAELKNWGVSEDELFLKQTAPDGRTVLIPDPPTFYKIIVPLVKAYVTVRTASLFNDRNQTPLLKFEPAVPNAETRMLCEMQTNITETIARDYGYSNVLRQAILMALQYSFCLKFPREVWHCEYQMQRGEDGKDHEELEKEGIRYHLPHPSVTSWDLNYNVCDFNTDTGPQWAQYWKIVRYGDVLDNKRYWNRRMVSYGRTDWLNPDISATFFSEVFPCQLNWPSFPTGGVGSSREVAASFYATNQRDCSCPLTDHFERLIPSKWDLGDYDDPIWTRWVVAGDTAVVYGEPCCYSPIIYYGYDADQLRTKNPSMALEVIPFQDQVGNLLSQILLTVKQNLANVYFYDENMIDRGQIDVIKNRGHKNLFGMNFVGFDSTNWNRAGWDVQKAIYPVNFGYKDPTPLFQAINTTLAILERLLQLTAQEQGGTASHQQSKEEVEQTKASSSNRVNFTGSFIDDGIDAWKRQQYQAQTAYMDSEVETYVSSDISDVEERLEELGFKILVKGDGKMKVRGSKHVIKIDSLAAAGRGPQRKNDAQTAQIMMQAVAPLIKNKEMLDAVGVKLVLKIIETAAKLAGADKDFRLKPDQQAEANQLQQMAQKIEQQVLQAVEKDTVAPVAKEIAQLKASLETVQRTLLNLSRKVMPKPPIAAPGVVQPNLPPPPSAMQAQPQPPNAPPTQTQTPPTPAGPVVPPVAGQQ